jgi:hypothetical protein
MMLVQNSNQQPSKKRNWMMLIMASRPTVNVIVVDQEPQGLGG